MNLPSTNFSGTVEATTLAAPTRESTLAVYAVTFAAGAHTHWHIHPKGQGIYVIDGIAVVQIEGQAPQLLAEGESIWIDAGQRHWHGATPEQPMTHVAYQQAADYLLTTCWQEPVTVKTYCYATKENH
ncbi:cupin domain-containing protein [Staphylococcus chromogenes]|nr:cupin domain-containing protein [Staphylococcus chromogenes]